MMKKIRSYLVRPEEIEKLEKLMEWINAEILAYPGTFEISGIEGPAGELDLTCWNSGSRNKEYLQIMNHKNNPEFQRLIQSLNPQIN